MTDPIRYIDTQESLMVAVQQLNQSQSLAIDLEFDKNYYRYGFNLCLVQIFDGDMCYLIDPLSEPLDIQILFPVLENEQIEKICFSFDEDLRLLNSLGCYPKNLYDLSLASRLLNDPPLSLTNILKEHLDIDTGSSSQQSNWFKRPLTEKQIHYAANDVLHLIKLREFTERLGDEVGISDWIREENKLLDDLDYSQINHNGFIKEKEKNGFSEIEWHIYKKCLKWQNDKGMKLNRPAYQIIPKSYLVEITKDVRKLMKWNQIKGIHRQLKSEEYKNELIELIKEAKNEAVKLNLSNSKPARKELSKSEYQAQIEQRREINTAKKELFKPIKNHIKKNYGSETANFLLSNRYIADLVTGNQDHLPDYRKELFINSARELSLDISSLKGYFN